jgi:hypothetical protein
MSDIKEITVIAKDRIGLLADVSEILSTQKINIESLLVETQNQTAIIRLVLQNADVAKKTLIKSGMKVMDADVIVLGLQDKPGELGKLSRILANSKISIDSVFVLSKEGLQTVMALKVNDYEGAKKLLREKKYL